MSKQAGFTLTELLIGLIVLVGASGWIWNVVKIATADFNDITGLLVLRVIGIFFAPLGAILGFL